MEFITILLSSLFTLIAPVGLIADQVAEGLIRERITRADLIDVRIDNVPNYQFLNGRVDRVRIAGRGVYPIPEVRIDTIDVETDSIDLDFGQLQRGRVVLNRPIQSAARLKLRTEDINQFLQSARVQQLLDTLRFSLPGSSAREVNRYGLANPRIEFLTGNRVRIVVSLRDRVEADEVEAVVETGIEIIEGYQLRLIDPQIIIDDQPVPQQLIDAFTEGIRDNLTLKQLEEIGIISRVLRFSLEPDAIDIAVFVRINPGAPLLGN